MHKISWMPNNYRHHESKNEEKNATNHFYALLMRFNF